MKKSLIKVSLLVAALSAIALIPSNTEMIFGYGNAPTFAGSTTNSPSCNKTKPDRVVLYEPNHALLPKATDANAVRLNWLAANNSTKYTVAFGTAAGNYSYGLPDVGNTTNFTVNNLVSGTKYYFVVRGVNDCMPGAWSKEWAVQIGGGGGGFTSTDTGSPTIVTPPNIPATLPPTGTSPDQMGNPGSTTTTVFTPPAFPTPTPQPGFFGNLWKGFLGIFGL